MILARLQSAAAPSDVKPTLKTISIVDYISVGDVLEAAGAPFKQRGRYVMFSCPRHDDTHPSAVGGQRGWRCFACGTKGGLLELGVALELGDDHAAVARRLEQRRP
jgi:hypothetical protein